MSRSRAGVASDTCPSKTEDSSQTAIAATPSFGYEQLGQSASSLGQDITVNCIRYEVLAGCRVRINAILGAQAQAAQALRYSTCHPHRTCWPLSTLGTTESFPETPPTFLKRCKSRYLNALLAVHPTELLAHAGSKSCKLLHRRVRDAHLRRDELGDMDLSQEIAAASNGDEKEHIPP